MRRIAVLTSGGDAPGMNAAIRAVVRTGIEAGWEVDGIRNGYAGLIVGSIVPLGARDVGGIIQQGGTVLGSARCPEFKTVESRQQALRVLDEHRIEALVVIGGNGSQTGAHALSDMGFPVVGVASTIDNDLYGSEITVGVDTALNVALEAIDRLKVTASSHHRAFLVDRPPCQLEDPLQPLRRDRRRSGFRYRSPFCVARRRSRYAAGCSPGVPGAAVPVPYECRPTSPETPQLPAAPAPADPHARGLPAAVPSSLCPDLLVGR